MIYLLIKTRKTGFGKIKYAEIKHVLTFKQFSVSLSNFLNRKNKKQGKKHVSEVPRGQEYGHLNHFLDRHGLHVQVSKFIHCIVMALLLPNAIVQNLSLYTSIFCTAS